MANGNSQKYRLDYMDTSSAVAQLTPHRALLAHASSNDWEIHQLAIKSAYLHAPLTEDVYMSLPSGYHHHEYENMVCKLKKGIYGLKQAGLHWYNKLMTTFH